MEIERKFLVKTLPENLELFPCSQISQAYLCTEPVIRIRQENDRYYLTCKGEGMMAREECNLPMSKETFLHLLTKAEGTIIIKKRYRIPVENGLHAELDCFSDAFDGLFLAEVEFPDTKTADSFLPPDWFGEEVTFDPKYHNSWMSRHSGKDLGL